MSGMGKQSSDPDISYSMRYKIWISLKQSHPESLKCQLLCQYMYHFVTYIMMYPVYIHRWHKQCMMEYP